MRSLLFKIFLWFWLALALVSVVFFFSVYLLEKREVRREPPWRDLSVKATTVYTATAARVFEREGRAGLLEYLELIEQTAGVRAALFDAGNQELGGRVWPAEVSALAAQSAGRNAPEFGYLNETGRPRPPEPMLAATTIRTRQGGQYTLVAWYPPPPQPPSRDGSRALVLRLLFVLLIGGLFCYWLARYLTGPLNKLRATTQDLAGGNLKARVGAALAAQGDEIGSLGRDFNRMAARIESLVTAQQRLIGDISHELRSPLARLRVALELARRKSGPAAGAELDRIEYESNNLNELIGQLLTLARFENGAEEPEKSLVELPVLVYEVAEDADFEARSRHCSVRVTQCDQGSLTGVYSLLRSALENVVRNAVSYTAAGTEVEVAHQRRAAASVVTVRDYGNGVPPDALEEIFRPFYRVEDARDRQNGGAGLGLSIAARAVRLHGGTITAANAPGGGLIITIELPADMP